jgi:hypothetical protein
MKPVTFWHGAGLALGLALLGAAGMATLPLGVGTNTALRLTVALLGAIYVLYVLHLSGERSGRIVVPCAWLLATVICWTWLTTPLFVIVQIGLIGLLRCLYLRAGILDSIADLCLSAVAFAGALWAAGTGSWFLTFWCFFLVMALFVWIPSPAASRICPATPLDRAFDNARTLADEALKRLATQR